MLATKHFPSSLGPFQPLFDPDSFFFVKNKHGPPSYSTISAATSPPSYDSTYDEETSTTNTSSTDQADTKFTQGNGQFPYNDEIIDHFGRSGGFNHLAEFFHLFSNIDQIAKFLQTFANSIHFLSVSSFFSFEYGSIFDDFVNSITEYNGK